MNRSALKSLKYLIIGLLVGALVSGGIDASAIVSPSGSASDAGAAAIAAAAKANKTKKKPAKKKKAKKHAKKKKKKKAKPPVASSAGIPLVGLFRITPGAYAGGSASGSHIRLVLPNGSVEKGPYFPNPNSKGGTYTLLNPGTDGGLRTGTYQPPPSPDFSLTGDALANRIMAPQRFAFILYSAATSPKDPQSGLDVPAPSISVTSDGKLSGKLQALSAAWNKSYFNQGSPKPDGSSPGLTSPVTGTFNADTKAYTMDWTSQVVGGPFNSFSGHWHLEGTFEPSC
ncbi:MAG: hypothetical protein QOD37_379 [Gaiellales bacterium]|nr:hypothetical protein [Gaiellales bacterium]